MRTFTGFGNSQWPVVKHGDQLLVDERGAKSIRVGDLVVFLRGKLHVCHRAVDRRETPSLSFLTKGDAMFFADGWCEAGQIVGKVVAVNGRPVAGWRYAVVAKFFIAHGRLQHRSLELIFKSSAGRSLGRLRARYLSPEPIFFRAFETLISPWKLLRRRSGAPFA